MGRRVQPVVLRGRWHMRKVQDEAAAEDLKRMSRSPQVDEQFDLILAIAHKSLVKQRGQARFSQGDKGLVAVGGDARYSAHAARLHRQNLQTAQGRPLGAASGARTEPLFLSLLRDSLGSG